MAGESVLLSGIIVDDIPQIIDLCKQCYDEMSFDDFGYGFDYDVVSERLMDVATNPDKYEVVTAWHDLKIVGIFICIYRDEHMWHRGSLHACENVFHTNPKLSTFQRAKLMTMLFAEMKQRVKARGVKAFHVGYDPRPEFMVLGKYLVKQGAVTHSCVAVITEDKL